jgi:hypothetical protein
MPDFEQIIPRNRLPINGGTTTRKWNYLRPGPHMTGLELIIPWFKDWAYWQSVRTDSQLILSQDGRNWTSLKEMFEQFGFGLQNSYYGEVMLSMKFEISKEGLYMVQTDGYISGELGPVYPPAGIWEFAKWSVPIWHNKVSPGFSISIK